MAKKLNLNNQLPTKKQTKDFDIVYPLLEAAIREVNEFSKKKPDGIINALKGKLLNKLLVDVKEIVKNEPTVQYLEILDEETLPSNSDAILILSQFKSAMAQFEDNYYKYDREFGSHRWYTKENYK